MKVEEMPLAKTTNLSLEIVKLVYCGSTGKGHIPSDDERYEQINHALPMIKKSELLLVPNPSNAQTTLMFDLPMDDQISIHLYDASGNQLGTILNAASVKKGKQSVDIQTAEMKSGIYFIKVQTSDGMKTTKMIVN